MIDSSKFLIPEADGLPTRESQEYAIYKWKALAFYLQVANTAIRNKWPVRYYIDLQSGSGKNHIGNSIYLGSPLIALTAPHPATHFRFNENDADLKDAHNALQTRVGKSEIADRVKIYHEDANEVVSRICYELTASDKKLASLNIAFLDPEGLELHWSTVEKLAAIKHMDLIINFSTMGIVRNIGSGSLDPIDRYFGTPQWREVDVPNDPVKRRRVFIDFYRQRLEKFGYHIDIDPDLGGDDIAVNNSKNAQVYSLLFASKHPLGDKIWKAAAKSVKPPKLPGFG